MRRRAAHINNNIETSKTYCSACKIETRDELTKKEHIFAILHRVDPKETHLECYKAIRKANKGKRFNRKNKKEKIGSYEDPKGLHAVYRPSPLGRSTGWLLTMDANAEPQRPYILHKRIPDNKAKEVVSMEMHVHPESGNIPMNLDRLKNLRKLHLSFVNISEVMPAIMARKLPKLENLKLSNMFYEFKVEQEVMVAEALKLKRLKKLALNGNSLEDIPKEIGNLKNLEELDLAWVYIITLPKTMAKMKKLRKLTLNSTCLRNLRLQGFDLDSNNTIPWGDAFNNNLTLNKTEIKKLQRFLKQDSR